MQYFCMTHAQVRISIGCPEPNPISSLDGSDRVLEVRVLDAFRAIVADKRVGGVIKS